MGGRHEFIQNNVCLLDARNCFFSLATGITPAMAVKIVGGGSPYAVATLDADRNLDGSKTYRLHVPPNVPVKPFWSLIPYDTQSQRRRLGGHLRRPKATRGSGGELASYRGW